MMIKKSFIKQKHLSKEFLLLMPPEINFFYTNTYNNYKNIVKDFSLDEKHQLFWKTALEVYNLDKTELKKAAVK